MKQSNLFSTFFLFNLGDVEFGTMEIQLEEIIVLEITVVQIGKILSILIS